MDHKTQAVLRLAIKTRSLSLAMKPDADLQDIGFTRASQQVHTAMGVNF